jgi:putative FmdB family regulatory protein
MATQGLNWCSVNTSLKHFGCSVFTGLGFHNVSHARFAGFKHFLGNGLSGCRPGLKRHGRTHSSYTRAMPTYEFRCKSCDSVFEERRSMSEADMPATCPEGHGNAVRLLSVFASVGGASAPQKAAPRPAGGCGSGCGCH